MHNSLMKVLYFQESLNFYFFLNVGPVMSILNLTVGKKSVTSFVTCN